MAESFLGSVVDSIIGHFISLATQEIGLICGVEGELKKLEMTASAIAALLREADRGWVDSEVVKTWLEKLKDVVYDADDLLDDYSTEALHHRRATGRCKRILNEVRVFFSPSNQIVYAYKMAHRVMDIRGNIDAITNDRVRFQLEGKSSSCPGSLVENPVKRETYPFESQPYVIGRDNDKKEVMEFLLDNDYEENVSILPIVGLGGLGKTTLARLVFNDEGATKNFALRLWVCVSINFNVENILRKILQECTPNEEHANLNMNQLQKRLEKELNGRRFLLVLDDVWNEDRREWLELQGFLRNSAKGSKILVTTRTPRVASTMAKTFHELRGLPEAESLSLLMRMAMKEEHEWRGRDLESIAKEILRKCAGVPLAITTIGRLLLFSRNTEEDWSNFEKNDLSRLNQKEGDIMPSLKLSFNFLPPPLKRCFAYCSLFPKDYSLNPSELIRLWIAQGFIINSPSNKKTLEEVGHDYFMELLSRSFFHCAKEDTYGDIVACEMHDLMHDLAQLVAGDSCFSISSSADVKRIPKGARHVCVVGLEYDGFKGFERDGRIRSLLFAVENAEWIDISNLDVSCFRNLRALRLQGVGVKKVISNSIGKLKHLRSLDLSLNYDLKSLPDSIGSLCNLESLNLRECRYLERLPRGLTKLVNLRHLDVADCGRLTHMPRGIGRLTSLQTLSVFTVREKGKSSGARLNELSRLVGLRKELTIQNLGNILDEVDTSFSMAKIALQSLKLRWENDGYRDEPNDEEVLERLRPHPNLTRLSIQGYGGSNISTWASQLHKLAVIEISDCYPCKHLPPLDHLPFLQRIILSFLLNLEWIELSDSGMLQCSFPSLEELKLTSLDKFKGWDQRRRSENGLEQGIQAEEEDSLLMLIPAFSEKIRVSVVRCPTFSYLYGQHLHLMQITNKILQEQLRISSSTRSQIPSMMTMTPISSISLAALTGLTIGGMEDVEHLPMNLIQSCPSLESLTIEDCPRLKSLSLREILQYLDALEMLEISWCDKLDLSIVNDDDDNTDGGEGMDNLQLRGHSKLRRISISDTHMLAGSPFELILCFPNLETLEISRVTCWSEDQDDMSSSQFSGSTNLRELTICGIEKMETLPGWIQHLTGLECLRLYNCSNIKALPGWFPKLTSLKTLEIWCCGELWRRCQRNEGEDWPKISHVERVSID